MVRFALPTGTKLTKVSLTDPNGFANGWGLLIIIKKISIFPITGNRITDNAA